MAGLAYVGAVPSTSTSTNIVNRLQFNAALATGISRAWVQGEVATQLANYATINAVNSAAGTFAQQSDVTSATAGLVLSTSLGVATTTASPPVKGVATLNTASPPTIPLAQLPNMGAGYVLGPYGPTSVSSGTSATTTPVKIADFNIGVQSLNFSPWAFASVVAQGTLLNETYGRACIEMRISNGTPTSYSATTLIARGVARNNYQDPAVISVVPILDNTQATPASYSPTYATWISMWIYDLVSPGVTFVAGGLVSSSIWLFRTS